MRFVLSSEEQRLNDLTTPYMKTLFNPFRIELDESAPKEIKEAYEKLQLLIQKDIQEHEEY